VSAKADADRRDDRRHAAAIRSDGILAKLTRLRAMWLDGKTDAEISEALGGAGCGWSKKSVKRYRHVLKLALHQPSDAIGRWSPL